MYSLEREIRLHPIGQLSPTGVLDVGLSCPHSCKFCYYSHFDGHDEQFHALRTLPYRPLDECCALADDFRSWGLTHCDVTGGEPALHPQICELIRHIEDVADIRARLITLGQFTLRTNKRTGRRLLDDLLDAGLSDFLFSFHADDPALFRELTKAQLEPLKNTMEQLDAIGMTYTTNTVVQQYNYENLPAIARYLAQRNVRFHSFIVMKLEWGWRQNPADGVRHKARYADLAPHLREAVAILEGAGKGVNVRYAPYCAMRGLERNIVGYKQVQLDPYEWRNGTRGARIEGTPYGGRPFLFHRTLEEYLAKHPRDVDTRDAYNMCQGEKCGRCSLRRICDGVDRDYVKEHGWNEFEPYAGAEIDDLVHLRRGYSKPYEMLQKPDAARPGRDSSASPRARESAAQEARSEVPAG